MRQGKPKVIFNSHWISHSCYDIQTISHNKTYDTLQKRDIFEEKEDSTDILRKTAKFAEFSIPSSRDNDSYQRAAGQFRSYRVDTSSQLEVIILALCQS